MSCHTEHELRFLVDAGFTRPEDIIGLPYLGSQAAAHLDVYFDCEHQGRMLLAEAKVNFRVRVLPDGARATLKVKRRPRGRATVREEHTSALLDAQMLDPANPVVAMALEITGGRALAEQLQIHTHRIDHHYLTREGAHVVLSEDAVTYPDGSEQLRVEAEIAQGDPGLLEAICAEMLLRHPEAVIADRGKYSEAKRRRCLAPA